MWCMGTKNRRYCTMYKKVLYNIKKIKKMWGGGGGGAIFEPKTLSMYLNQSRTNGPINAHLTIAQVMPKYNHNNEKQEALL